MRTNIQYMSQVPEQFKGERETQRESNQRAAEKAEPRKTLDWMIRQCIGTEAVGYAQLFPYATRQQNPYTFFYGNVAGIDTPASDGFLSELEALRAVSSVTDTQWEEFEDSVVDFLMTLDESNSEALTHPDRWAEIDVEDNSWSDPESDPYMESQFAKDVETETPLFTSGLQAGRGYFMQVRTGVMTTDRPNGTTSELMDDEYAFFPSGSFDFPKYTVGSRNWGFYNEAATEGYAFGLMRMRWFADMFLVGGVQIKSDGLAKCGVSGCRWSHELRSNSVEGSTVFDRRYAEYQTLLILAHLGEHTRRNPSNYWTPIDCVKRGRDTATMKLDSASRFC